MAKTIDEKKELIRALLKGKISPDDLKAQYFFYRDEDGYYCYGAVNDERMAGKILNETEYSQFLGIHKECKIITLIQAEIPANK